MKASFHAGYAAAFAVLAASPCAAGSPAPRPVPASTVMQVHVVGTEDAAITDPEGRQYPCRDSTCRPIPRCQAVTGFGTLPRGTAGGEAPKQIVFEIYAPIEGVYCIHAAGGGGQSTILSVDVSDSTMHCGKTDAVDESPNTSRDWIMKWRRIHQKPGCSLTLARGKARGRR